MAKRIIFVHGRSQKPCEKELRRVWFEAVEAGLERDFGLQGKRCFNALGESNKIFVYYGDLSNKFLDLPEEDATCRYESLDTLKAYSAEDFSQASYDLICGSRYLDAIADTISKPLSTIGVAGPIIKAVAKDVSHYWNEETYFGSDVRNRLTLELQKAFDSGDEILLVAHSLGSMVSYDNLWKFSHYGEYRQKYGANKKVDLFITLGSPLGDENVKQHLKGSNSKNFRKYPTNIRRWHNFAAEDDYISHDVKLADDYKEMNKLSMLSENIQDHKIFNLCVKSGKSNPHASVGYLIHPEFTKLVYEWLNK